MGSHQLIKHSKDNSILAAAFVVQHVHTVGFNSKNYFKIGRL